MDHLSNLPIEIKLMIFDFLPILDVIGFKKVSKEFKIFIETHVRFKSLTTLKPSYAYSTKPDDSIVITYDSDLRKIVDNQLWSKIRKMKTSNLEILEHEYSNRPIRDCNKVNHLFENFFNHFKYLEILNIKALPITAKNKSFTLNLKKLKKLYTDCCCELDLKTPELEYLECHQLYPYYSFAFPEKIKTLSLDFCDHYRVDEFINLEKFVVRSTYFLTNPESFDCSKFKASKAQIHFYDTHEETFEIIKKFFVFLNSEHSERLKFFINGLELSVYRDKLIGTNEIEAKKEYKAFFTKMLAENVSKTSDEIKIETLDFKTLVKANLREENMKILGRKLKCLDDICIDWLIEESEVKMVKNYLKIIRPGFLSIYSNLNDSMRKNLLECKFIHTIRIKEYTNELIFLLKMKNLKKIIVHKEVSINFILEAFLELNNLQVIQLAESIRLLFIKVPIRRSLKYFKIHECDFDEHHFNFFQAAKMNIEKGVYKCPEYVDETNELIPKLIYACRKVISLGSVFDDQEVYLTFNRL